MVHSSRICGVFAGAGQGTHVNSAPKRRGSAQSCGEKATRHEDDESRPASHIPDDPGIRGLEDILGINAVAMWMLWHSRCSARNRWAAYPKPLIGTAITPPPDVDPCDTLIPRTVRLQPRRQPLTSFINFERMIAPAIYCPDQVGRLGGSHRH